MSDDTITWREVAAETQARLSVVSGSPANEARWIIERAAGFDGAEYILGLDERVTERGMHFHDLMLERRLAGEPIQYVLGRWGFRTLDLFVDARVLIPRPETEVVAGIAIAELDRLREAAVADGRDLLAVDLGTGSGAIGLSIAAERERVDVVLADRSSDALAVAGANLVGIGRGATRVRLAEGSWYDALDPVLLGSVDVIVSNPPYVALGDEIEDIVRDWEPSSALFAGVDGLDDLRVIVEGAPDWLRPSGALVLEMSSDQVGPVTELARRCGFVDITTHRDLAERDRAIVARLPV